MGFGRRVFRGVRFGMVFFGRFFFFGCFFGLRLFFGCFFSGFGMGGVCGQYGVSLSVFSACVPVPVNESAARAASEGAV